MAINVVVWYFGKRKHEFWDSEVWAAIQNKVLQPSLKGAGCHGYAPCMVRKFLLHASEIVVDLSNMCRITVGSLSRLKLMFDVASLDERSRSSSTLWTVAAYCDHANSLVRRLISSLSTFKFLTKEQSSVSSAKMVDFF